MPTWLEDIAGPNFAPAVLWTLLALVVLVIVLVIVRIVRSMTFGTFVAGGRNRKTRLAVMDAAAVDSHRRLVLVRRDDVEHLILIGGPTDVVVERDIRLHAPARRPANAGESPADAQTPRPRPQAPNGQQPNPEQRRPAPVAPRGAARPARNRATRDTTSQCGTASACSQSPRPAAVEACPAKNPAAIGGIAAQFLDAARSTCPAAGSRAAAGSDACRETQIERCRLRLGERARQEEARIDAGRRDEPPARRAFDQAVESHDISSGGPA